MHVTGWRSTNWWSRFRCITRHLATEVKKLFAREVISVSHYLQATEPPQKKMLLAADNSVQRRPFCHWRRAKVVAWHTNIRQTNERTKRRRANKNSNKKTGTKINKATNLFWDFSIVQLVSVFSSYFVWFFIICMYPVPDGTNFRSHVSSGCSVCKVHLRSRSDVGSTNGLQSNVLDLLWFRCWAC